MQKHRNKLALGRETVRILQPSHLRGVAGGMIIDPTKPPAQPISVLTE